MKAAKQKGTVGVIGLGIMGGSYARHLSAAGWRVLGFDTNPARCRKAARAGVTILRDGLDPDAYGNRTSDCFTGETYALPQQLALQGKTTFDYRIFSLMGSPVESKVHRFYAGANLAF